jgi:hypothetical protein
MDIAEVSPARLRGRLVVINQLAIMVGLFMEAGITNAPDAILNSVYRMSWITLCTVVAFWMRLADMPVRPGIVALDDAVP